MKMTERERGLLAAFRKLESEKSREDVIFQAEAMVRAQEALREDYGLTGRDTPSFNGFRPEVPPVRARRGSTEPVLA
jgi:hypothetical protein